MLDSSILIGAERRRFDLPALLDAHPDEAVFICAITASELLHGVERAESKPRRMERADYVEKALQRLPVIDFDLHMARHHASLWAHMEKRGLMIGAHDLQIASTALSTGHALATLNRKEFQRVPKLVLVNVTPFILAQ